MFIFKESTEMIMLEEEIKVVGLSLQLSGLPISFDSLGKLWEKYGADYRGKNKIQHVITPVMEYGIALNTVPDYITGCGVSAIEEMDEACLSFVLPKGKYIKDTFNAESFEMLTNEAISKRKVSKWAKAHQVKIDGTFVVEVYPWETFRQGVYEMYTLTPIKE